MPLLDFEELFADFEAEAIDTSVVGIDVGLYQCTSEKMIQMWVECVKTMNAQLICWNILQEILTLVESKSVIGLAVFGMSVVTSEGM
jgi:hypothetical protein